MQLVFYKDTGLIASRLDDNLDLDICLYHYSEEQKKNMDSITVNDDWIDISIDKYIVKNLKLVEVTDYEMMQIRTKGRLFTEDEKLIRTIIPEQEEVEKAKRTIEYLDLMKEVVE